jgi:hypothetical protein
MELPARSIERLKAYLAQLPPKSQALLMREFEKAVEKGNDDDLALLVLEQLRLIVRAADTNDRQRSIEPSRIFFRPVEPFLVEDRETLSPGQIRRGSLAQIWNWLARDAISEAIAEFELVASETDSASEVTLRKAQVAAAVAIEQITAPAARDADQRSLSRIGGSRVIEDLRSVGIVLKNREALETFTARIAGNVRNLADSQLVAVQEALNIPALQTPQCLPFALQALRQKMSSPWQIIRLAIAIAGSDDETRVASTPYGVAVTMAINETSDHIAQLREDIARGRLDSLSHRLKVIHDSLRGLRAELDVRNESAWGKRLSAIRAETSNVLKSEIEVVPGRVRRLLRQRSDKDIIAGFQIDPDEVDETAGLIDFVAVCRTYASELAINEVTLRTFSDLQHYTESATEALLESLRASDAKTRPLRQLQVEAAVRFCEILFGSDYASLMRKAADVALTVERKSKATRGG